jgi:hypothetical protein
MPRKTLAVVLALFAVAMLTAFDKKAIIEADFNSKCPLSHRLPDDPIVYPGTPGASHMHDFFGNTSTDANSKHESMTGERTTCIEEPADKAGYWTPTLYANDVEQRIKGAFVIYKAHDESVRDQVRPFPKDLKVVTGNARAETFADNPLFAQGKIGWNCYGGQQGYTDEPIDDCIERGGAFQDLYIIFPSCWDGVKTKASDQSHVAYFDPSTKRCLDSHPVTLPQLTLWVRYQEFNASDGRLASGDWRTVHADLWNTWHQPRLAELVERCVNRDQDEDCPRAPG